MLRFQIWGASRIGAVTIALLAILAASPPLFPAAHEEASPGPSIVLITIDTLRADHLSCYGYTRETSPFIDSIAKEGVVFANAYSTSSWTAPSMASIFTGLYPRSHGVLHGAARSHKVVKQEILSPELATIPAVLKQAGYKTFGVSSNGHMSKETGFARGFDFFTEVWFADSPEPNRLAKSLLPEIKKASKFFLWVHYFDPHASYRAREPWIRRYNADPNACKTWSEVSTKVVRGYHSAEIKKNPAARKVIVDLYDSEINYCDFHLKDLFAMLPLNEESLIIITSDHGEEFLEHGLLGHAKSLYEEVIRVPLIIRLPNARAAKRTVPVPVSNKDILPTICDVVGATIPKGIKGKSLLPLLAAGSPSAPEPVYAELDRGRYWRAMREGKWKFIFRGRQRNVRLLYNLHADAGEMRNLLTSAPDQARHLESTLDKWMHAHPPFIASQTERILDKDQEEKLRSLGYLK